jgi:mRNA interferase RelE/StbE
MKYNVYYTDCFLKSLAKFSQKRQGIILNKIKILKENPDHPSLRTEKLYKGTKKSVRASSINMNIRIIWQIEDDIIDILDVGGHDIYKQY